MSDVWFTSDTHYGHRNIILHSNRPFQFTEEMDRAMIDNWNEVVKPGDRVYHLGDFSFHKPDKTLKIFQELKGNKYLIKGNHDSDIEKVCKDFIWVKDTETIKVGEQLIFMSHYAHRVWNRSHYGCWNLHGHSHGSLPRLPGYKQLDVGVDCWGFRPVNFDELVPIMDQIKFTPVDHHGMGGNR